MRVVVLALTWMMMAVTGCIFFTMVPMTGTNLTWSPIQKRGQGLVIMTNGDNGKELWPEILDSVSVEYGWLKDYTGL